MKATHNLHKKPRGGQRSLQHLQKGNHELPSGKLTALLNMVDLAMKNGDFP